MVFIEVLIFCVGSLSIVINGNIYVFLGCGGFEMRLIEENGVFWCYNVEVVNWSLVKFFYFDRLYFVGWSYYCIVLDNKKNVFVYFGCLELGCLVDFWVFDILIKIWFELL